MKYNPFSLILGILGKQFRFSRPDSYHAEAMKQLKPRPPVDFIFATPEGWALIKQHDEATVVRALLPDGQQEIAPIYVVPNVDLCQTNCEEAIRRGYRPVMVTDCLIFDPIGAALSARL